MPRIGWTGVDGAARRGEVWCPGPSPDSVWVIPDEPMDGEGRAVCVGLDGQQTTQQAERSQEQWQVLTGMQFASDPCFTPDFTTRGGQLTARIAPRVGVPVYPDVEIQTVYACPLVDVELPDLSREDTS